VPQTYLGMIVLPNKYSATVSKYLFINSICLCRSSVNPSINDKITPQGTFYLFKNIQKNINRQALRRVLAKVLSGGIIEALWKTKRLG
jgi:hypothetical protein